MTFLLSLMPFVQRHHSWLLGERLQFVFSHDEYLLLRYSIAIPKLLYRLRTCHCFLSPSLKLFDDELRSIMCSAFNLPLPEGHPEWVQATLPIKSVWRFGHLKCSAACSFCLFGRLSAYTFAHVCVSVCVMSNW